MYLIGADFNIYKKWGAEIYYSKSLKNFFRFDKSDEIKPRHKNKLIMLQISLNYKL